MKARYAAVLAGLAIAGGVLAAVWLVALGGSSSGPGRRTAGPPPQSYAELVAANYRVLSGKQSRRLLRFADSFVACMAKRGIALGHPHPLVTKIVMALPPGVTAMSVATQSFACGDKLGGPPKGASLVQPKGEKAIELYLPKRCLLDRKVVEGQSRR